MSPRLRLLLPLGLVALAALAALALLAAQRTPPVPTLRLAAGPFRHEITADGALVARRATPVQAPAEAAMPMRVAWLLPDGSAVATGDLVARFDPSEAADAMADAEGNRTAADRKLDRHRAGAGATAHELEREAALARTELAAAERFQAKDELVFSRHQRIESEIDAGLAAERERNARLRLATQGRVAESDERLLALERAKAELAIARAAKGLSALTVAAPHDGIFSLRTDWRGNAVREGETLWPGQPFAEIPDLSRLDAEVWVLEADAGGLAEGLEGTVRLAATPGVELAARVERVDKIAKPRQRGVPVQYFGATLALAGEAGRALRPGERVRARIVIADLPEVLTVPRQALFEDAGRRVVFRQLPGRGRARFEPVAVETGVQGLGRVVLVSGLAAGDVVALADPRAGRAAGEKRPQGANGGPP